MKCKYIHSSIIEQNVDSWHWTNVGKKSECQEQSRKGEKFQGITFI